MTAGFAVAASARRGTRGLTLIEVLIAIGLLLVLSGAMFGFLYDLLLSRARTLEHVQQQRAATTLIERLEADLASCVTGDAVHGAGIVGSSTQIRVLTRGVAGSIASANLSDAHAFGDLQSAEYRLDSASARVQGSRGPVGDAGKAEVTAIEGAVHALRFRYYDGSMWRDDFNSQEAGRLPVAVELSIWHRPWPGDVSGGQSQPERPASAAASDREFASNFDEYEFAMSSDLELFDPPPPDRLRIFLIADAEGPGRREDEHE